VVDQGTGAVLMSGTSTGKAQFFSGNDLVTIQRQAMSDAAANLADNLSAVLTEGW
jgi:hypothetical protein